MFHQLFNPYLEYVQFALIPDRRRAEAGVAG